MAVSSKLDVRTPSIGESDGESVSSHTFGVQVEAGQSKRKRNTRRPWSAEEDVQLKNIMKARESNCAKEGGKAAGRISWLEVAKQVPGRSSKQCRDRWLSINPDVDKREWTQEEDELLIALYQKYQNRWVKIASNFNGRNDNMIKSRFRALSRMGRVEKAFSTRSPTSNKRSRGSSLSQSSFSSMTEKLQDTKQLRSFQSSGSTVSVASLLQWDDDEDKLLMELVKLVGTENWGVVVGHFHGRTQAEVQGRYSFLLGVLSRQKQIQQQQQQQQQQQEQQQQSYTKNGLEMFIETLKQERSLQLHSPSPILTSPKLSMSTNMFSPFNSMVSLASISSPKEESSTIETLSANAHPKAAQFPLRPTLSKAPLGSRSDSPNSKKGYSCLEEIVKRIKQ